MDNNLEFFSVVHDGPPNDFKFKVTFRFKHPGWTGFMVDAPIEDAAEKKENPGEQENP